MGQGLLVVVLAVTCLLCAQRRVDPRNSYHRMICVVPLTGAGTAADRKRPKYAPWPVSQNAGADNNHSGPVQWSIVEFDDCSDH